MNAVETAWVAGLLEGEGCFGWWKNKGAIGGYSARVYVNSNDKDVIHKLARVTGMGRTYGPRHRKAGNPYYSWIVARQEEAVYIMCAVLPHMGYRRSDKIVQILDSVESLEEAS